MKLLEVLRKKLDSSESFTITIRIDADGEPFFRRGLLEVGTDYVKITGHSGQCAPIYIPWWSIRTLMFYDD